MRAAVAAASLGLSGSRAARRAGPSAPCARSSYIAARVAASSDCARARISSRDSGENSAKRELLVVELLRRGRKSPFASGTSRFSSQIWCCEIALRARAMLARKGSCSAGGSAAMLLRDFAVEHRDAGRRYALPRFRRVLSVRARDPAPREPVPGNAAVRRAACRDCAAVRAPARNRARSGCTGRRRRARV